MPNIKAAAKALRKSKKLQIRNTKVKSNLESFIKKSRKAIAAKSDTAKDLIQQAIKAIDKAAQKGIIKPNTGKRKKSRLMKKFNAIMAK
ncbi:30S ribosomal protein S20 [Candidatus Falkowbacteria bacterium CG10_big_fil_rev_8_21_14_0_10_44_15]|uniref:Small ribosomal subunit protein bS20 n=1 Tax=Candidatus Falkowbacteria bacterium CG10_big_fil_rev_8_21_14_0_10_44_15 TaxID=1974569 RepID=A0A2H0V289_9BACT|nr:MAG: 30S ribosomal protein S20 [Candidatus Falkowbacteria bacterium CG10_big_fil_rev_8_21_14_0_10_44_15]